VLANSMSTSFRGRRGYFSAMQRILRHSDVRTTTGIYGHLLVDDLRPAVAAIAPTALPPPQPSPFAASLLHERENDSKARNSPDDFTSIGEIFHERARRESNPDLRIRSRNLFSSGNAPLERAGNAEVTQWRMQLAVGGAAWRRPRRPRESP